MVVNRVDNQVLCTCFGKGRQHDFKLLKSSRIRFSAEANVLADSGYQGLERLHKKTELAEKKGCKKVLSKADTGSKQGLSSRRILVAHVIGSLKGFRILSERYRNCRKRFGLCFNRIAAIYNFEL